MSSAVQWYDAHASTLVRQYADLDPNELHKWFVDLIPVSPSLVMDVGAGCGRDAVWFASKGHRVLAIEPSANMLREGEKASIGREVRWIQDSLPGLAEVGRSGLSADLVFLNAVWQHIAPDQRQRAFRKLVRLLRSGGLLVITLRAGPAEDEREMYPVSVSEIEQLAQAHGILVVRIRQEPDRSGRSDVYWTNIALRLPDDGTGALPLLRHVILDQSKSSTYKLALLRTLCRAADGASGMTRQEDDSVSLPLGLVALNWIRMYLPLLLADLPQTPRNHGPEGLSFAGQGFRALLSGGASPLDFRVGRSFGPEQGKLVLSALYEAADTIISMPARYLTYPNGGPILTVTRNRRQPSERGLSLDAALLWSFGEVRVPRDPWQAMSRFTSWIEPSILTEWTLLMQAYAAKQGRQLEDTKVAAALTWSDPQRDVSLSRQIATSMLDRGFPLHCVWSGRRLHARILDIDHCLPWSAWPCGDLWNLMPADRSVNQNSKRGKLPSHAKLIGSRDAIQAWWSGAYLHSGADGLTNRFSVEAASSLPGIIPGNGPTFADTVFGGLQLQRLRLWQNQRIPEWNAQ